jgi:hypothetical protein
VKVVRCNGCGVDVTPKDWPRVSGAAGESITMGGALNLYPRQEFDFCPLCTIAAFTAVEQATALIKELRVRGLTGVDSQQGLKEYLLAGPLTTAEAIAIAGRSDREVSSALVARYGSPAWRVAHAAMKLLTAPGSAPAAVRA